MSTIIIRNLSRTALIGLDDLAKRKGVSRESYVRTLLENLVRTQNVTGEMNDLNEVLNHALTVIENNTVAFNKINRQLKTRKDINL